MRDFTRSQSYVARSATSPTLWYVRVMLLPEQGAYHITRWTVLDRFVRVDDTCATPQDALRRFFEVTRRCAYEEPT